MSYQFFQLPTTDEPQITYLSFPVWIKDAIATKDVRVTADGEDVYVRTPTDEVLVEPTDYILKSSQGNFYVVPAPLFEDLAGIHATPRPKPEPEPDPNPPTSSRPFGAPPYSPTVLAKSARARAEQAAWEATPPPSDEPIPTPTADNAHLEGADEPDSPR